MSVAALCSSKNLHLGPCELAGREQRMGMLGWAVRKCVVLPGGQRSGLLHGSCLRHGHPLRRVSYPPEQMREEGRGLPSSAGSAASAGIGARGTLQSPMSSVRTKDCCNSWAHASTSNLHAGMTLRVMSESLWLVTATIRSRDSFPGPPQCVHSGVKSRVERCNLESS